MSGTSSPRTPALALALGILWAFLSCISCANPFSSPSSSIVRKSSLKLSIGALASRSIVPGETDYLNAIKAYKVTVSNSANTYTSTTVVSGVCTITEMAAGTYAVTVQAYSDSGASTQIADGTTNAIITTGVNTTVSVTLSFSQAANTGGFSLDIAWPVSTGLPYLYATLDGTAIGVPVVTSGPTNCTATLAASNISGGPHILRIYFKASTLATTAIGPYIESVNVWDGVTDTMWADSNGTLQSTLSLNPGEFASSDASLAGLSVGTVGLGPAFAPATYGYGFGGALTSGALYSFTIVADSASQGISCAFNGSTCVLTAISATAMTGSFTAASGTNMLAVTVTAADKKTANTYLVATSTVISGGSYTSSTFQTAVSTAGTFVLAGDVTISNAWTSAIGGSTTAFTGTFDGNGHTITIAGGSADGLFYTVSGTGIVENLHVDTTLNPSGYDKGMIADYIGPGGTIANCSSSGTVSGGNEVAGIVGYAKSGSTITHCTNTANITGSADNTGGICAYCDGATIEYCVNTGNVTGIGNYKVGGVVGVVYSGSVSYSYNTGTVTELGLGQYIGGVCGLLSSGFITDSYNAGTVAASSATYVGGLAGMVNAGCTVTYCYSYGSVSGLASVGGLVGANTGAIISCFYDTNASGQSDPGKGTPETTAAMKSLATYVGGGWLISSALDLAYDWGLDGSSAINNGYPYLQVFGASTLSP